MARSKKGKKAGKGKQVEIANKQIENDSDQEAPLHPVASTPVTDTLASVSPIPAPSASASMAPVNGAENVTQAKVKGKGDAPSSGYIFMCNGRTKPECYKYRVFGLPPGNVHVVQNIKEGAKLFLYDFDLKLLYGIYKATSTGGHGLEPAAFGGRFPAQVRFQIVKDCLPLPEREFRDAIIENYNGRKFKPELSNKQVKKLIAMFRPITLPPSGHVHPLPQVPNARPQQNPIPARGEWFQHSLRLPHQAQVEARYGPPRTATAPSEAYYQVPPPVDARYGQPLPASAPKEAYYPEHPPVYVTDNPALHAQDPYTARYRSEVGQHPHLYLEREAVQQAPPADGYYSQYSSQSASHGHPPPPYIPAPYPPTSHVHPQASHPPVDFYSQGPYIARVYGEPPPRPASGIAGRGEGNAPVSSLYSFDGQVATYR